MHFSVLSLEVCESCKVKSVISALSEEDYNSLTRKHLSSNTADRAPVWQVASDPTDIFLPRYIHTQ